MLRESRERERERERDRQTDRGRQRQRDRDRETGAERQRQSTHRLDHERKNTFQKTSGRLRHLRGQESHRIFQDEDSDAQYHM